MRRLAMLGGLVLAGGAMATPRAVPQAPLPRFDRVVQLEDSGVTSANASIGDVNGDGKPDIVLAKGRHWPLVDRVLLGDGAGHFTRGTDLGSASDRSYSGLLVDLDRDGDLDAVISNDRPDPKRTYLNDGRGHFTAGSSFGRAEWSTRNASVADVDGDGWPDIVVANRTGNRPGANYICPNRGGGRFDAECVLFSRESATTITPADVNGDGLVDLVVPHRDGGQGQVYLHRPGATPAFRAVPFGPADATIRMSAVVDLDRDGHPDIVAIDERRGLALYFGQGNERFAAGITVGDTARTPYALAAGDLNSDGAVDLVVGYVESPSIAWINDGTGRHFTPVTFGDGKGTPYGFALGDLDGDGRVDIVAARSEAPNVAYLAGGPAGAGGAETAGARGVPTPRRGFADGRDH